MDILFSCLASLIHKFQFNSPPGYVFTRGGYVELSKRLSLPLDRTLDRYEGLVLSVGGNGRSYVLILAAGPSADTTQSKLYFARISTKIGFCRVISIKLLNLFVDMRVPSSYVILFLSLLTGESALFVISPSETR